MSLREKLQDFQKREFARSQDARARLSAWSAALYRLYEQIGHDLHDYTQERLIKINTDIVKRFDDTVELYDVPSLLLEVGPHRIVLDPVGFRVIGAGGRVDVHREGHRSEGAMLLWQPAGNPESEWQIAFPNGQGSPQPYSKGSLEVLIERLIEG